MYTSPLLFGMMERQVREERLREAERERLILQMERMERRPRPRFEPVRALRRLLSVALHRQPVSG